MKPDGRTKHGEATRRDLLLLIRNEGGLHISELARRLDVSHTNARHHLDRLRRQGAIRPFREGRRVHWFAVDVSAQHHFGLAVLHDDHVSDAIERLRDNPGLNLTGLADLMDVTPKVASRVIRRLEDAGYVRPCGRRGFVISEDPDQETF